MKTAVKEFFTLIRETVKQWSEDKASRLAAALAYYTIFSLAPLLIIVIGIAGLVFNEQGVRQDILTQVEDMSGEQGREMVATMLDNVSEPRSSTLATLVGVGLLLFGASGLFAQLQSALNTIWNIETLPQRSGRASLINMVQKRFLSFAMVLIIGFLLLVSLILSAAISGVTNYVEDTLPTYGTVGALSQILNILLSLAVITGLFAVMYKVLPDAKIAWRDVWLGAFVTAGLFTIGKYLIGLYLGQSSVASTYGAAGSLIVLLLWVYYSAQILLFGAEFTQVYANRYGAKIEPEEHARLTDDTREDKTAPSPAATQPQKPQTANS